MLQGNYIDANVFIHRRALVQHFGAWDTLCEPLDDWDIALRYTEEKPAHALNVLAAQYRVCDNQRDTLTKPQWPNYVAVRSKWFPARSLTRRPRVLYLLSHYPQLSEAYLETELRCLRSWGVEIDVWRSEPGPAPYPTDVAVHDGNLADVVSRFRPDILHVHSLSFGKSLHSELAAHGLPVMLRLQDFDTTRLSLIAWLGNGFAKAVYVYPGQKSRLGIDDGRVKPLPVAFDSRLFSGTRPPKDNRLVLRVAAALPNKDLELFMEAAQRLPEYRFVLAVAKCQHKEDYVTQLQETCRKLGSPTELRFDVPHHEIAELLKTAGIYFHTMLPPGTQNSIPAGALISIVESMAAGCYCLVPDVPELTSLVEGAGASYRDLENLLELIRSTGSWTESAWKDTRSRAIEKAYQHHADREVYRTVFDDWITLLEYRADVRVSLKS